MADDLHSASDMNGLYWVLFRSTGKETFEYKEAVRDGERAILVFNSQDRAQAYATQDKSHAIAAQFDKEYKPITLESLELWRNFFERREGEGIGFVALNPTGPDSEKFQTTIRAFIQQLDEQFGSPDKL